MSLKDRLKVSMANVKPQKFSPLQSARVSPVRQPSALNPIIDLENSPRLINYRPTSISQKGSGTVGLFIQPVFPSEQLLHNKFSGVNFGVGDQPKEDDFVKVPFVARPRSVEKEIVEAKDAGTGNPDDD